MVKRYTDEQAIAVMRTAIIKYGTQKKMAAALGVTSQYISDILNGRRPISDRMAQAIGLKKTAIFEADK